MPKAFRHPVYDVRAGILLDWYGVTSGAARLLLRLYDHRTPAPTNWLCKKERISESTLGTYLGKLRRAGVEISDGRGKFVYTIGSGSRLEVQKAFAHAYELLGAEVPDMDEHQALKDALGLTWESPLEWRLTPQENRFAGLLMRTPVVHRERLMGALYADRSDPPSDKILDVMATHMRHKLRPFGLTIRSKCGVGYYLAETPKAA